MTARVLDGQALAVRMQEEIKPQVAEFVTKHGRPPGLGIVLVGNDPASQVYVRNKVKAGGDVGFRVDLERMPETSTLADVLALVDRLNNSPAIDGILVQSPLPKVMGAGAQQQVFDTIAADKDVDGFSAESVGLLSQNRPKLVACTPAGVIELLERDDVEAVLLGPAWFGTWPLAHAAARNKPVLCAVALGDNVPGPVWPAAWPGSSTSNTSRWLPGSTQPLPKGARSAGSAMGSKPSMKRIRHSVVSR